MCRKYVQTIFVAHCRASEAHFNGEAGEGLPELEVEKKKLRLGESLAGT